MRYNIQASLSGTNKLVRFEEIFTMTKDAFLRLVRNNIPLDAMGRFSYGTVYGGTMVKRANGGNALSFADGAFWNFSTTSKDLMFNVYEGIARNEEFAFGMYIDTAEEVHTHYVDGLNFITCRPGMVVRDILQDGTMRMYTVLTDGDDFIAALEDNTYRKIMEVAPHLDPRVTIRPVEGEVYKRKSAWVDNIYYNFNEGVFSINASKEVLELLSCIGLGDLTHLGFGHIVQVQNPLKRGLAQTRILSEHQTQWISGRYLQGQSLQREMP